MTVGWFVASAYHGVPVLTNASRLGLAEGCPLAYGLVNLIAWARMGIL